jgi:membrane protein
MRLVRKLDSLEWIARLENLRVPRYVLIANPQQITVASLFELFVIESEELDYQLRLDSSNIDRAVLMNALSNEKLDVTLATLVAARAASRQEGAREAQGAGSMPHQTA